MARVATTRLVEIGQFPVKISAKSVDLACKRAKIGQTCRGQLSDGIHTGLNTVARVATTRLVEIGHFLRKISAISKIKTCNLDQGAQTHRDSC